MVKPTAFPAVAGIGIFAAILGVLAFSRHWVGFGTETDFLGFVSEARDVTSGARLSVGFQPPLYPFLLAVGHLFEGDWFRVGLFLSWIAAVGSVALSFRFFDRLDGREAAWGSAVAMATSSLMLSFGAQASTDMPFLFLQVATFLVGLEAMRQERAGSWVLLGALIGATLLTRVNGLPLLALLVTPWLAPSGNRPWRGQRLTLSGLGLVLLAWGGWAAATGSPFYPGQNHVSLAMTYFVKDERVWEAFRSADQQFPTLWSVLTYDPISMAKQYLSDLADLPRRLIEIPQFPLSAFALPGLLFLAFRKTSRFLALFLVTILAEIAMLNLKTYEARFYLVVLPLLGAGAGVLAGKAWRILKAPWQRVAVAFSMLGLLAWNTRSSLLQVSRELHASDRELSESVPAARSRFGAQAVVIARKPHLSYYTGARYDWLPEASDLDQLADSLRGFAGQDSVYLYFGAVESSLRPGLRVLLDTRQAPAWLAPMAAGRSPDWAIYRILPQR